MTYPHTKKTPVAELGGERDEGLTNTPNKEMNTMQSTALTPAQYMKRRRALDQLDLPALARGTVVDLFHAAERTGIDPSDLIRLIEEDEL